MNKQILRLSIPFIISNISVPLVGTVDTALMGHLGSTTHLGAIGLGGALFNFLYWNFAFIRMSTGGFTAQAYGANNENEKELLLGRALIMALSGAVLLLLLQTPILNLALRLMKGEADVELHTITYYKIRIWAAPATLSMYAITGWFIGMQNAKAPMLTSILVNVFNLCLNFLFILGFKMKSDGVALGTVIAQYLGLFFSIGVIYFKYRKYLKVFTNKALWHLSSYKHFFKVNSDIFVRTFFVILVLTFYNFASSGKGNDVLGMNVIFLQLIYAFSFFTDGFANAAEALAGKYIGAQNKLKLKRLIRLLFIWGVAIATIFTLVYAFFWPYILKIYTSDTVIIQLSQDYIYWIVAIPLISITAFIWDGIYLGATSSQHLRNATLLGAVVFFSVYYGLQNNWGNHALLFAQFTFFGVRGIYQTITYKKAIFDRLNF